MTHKAEHADQATTRSIEMSKPNFELFKQLYTRAVEKKQEYFVYQNRIILTSYAKYVIEFLEFTRGWK